MSDSLALVIGNRNYSSWSLRGCLALAAADLDFEVTLIQLDTPTARTELETHSPSGKVPVLHVRDDSGETTVWDSLAIAEWAAERTPRLWPTDPRARAHARSAAAEMHAGFAALRRDMPMNIRGRFPGVGHSAEALADIERVVALWRHARGMTGSRRFLYGDDFGVADAMYAPVATRLVTYGVALTDDIARYIDAVYAFPAMAAWIDAANAEPWECLVAEPASARWTGGPLET